MLANTHITANAIRTLTSWAVTRARLALAALKRATKPTLISTSIAHSSRPSTCRVRYSPMRLIVGILLFDRVAPERLRLLAQQVIVEHLACYRHGGGPT